MGKVNGSSILLYVDGVLVACQTGMSMSIEQNLFPTTNKSSGGFHEHGNGERSFSIPFDALVSTTGLSAAGLYDIIINRSSAALLVEGFQYLWIMAANLQNSSISAPKEEATKLTGTFMVNGKPHKLGASNLNKITIPNESGYTYDNLTISGIKITDADKASGTAYCDTNTFSVTTGEVLMLFVVLTTSGQNPLVRILNSSSGAMLSNEIRLVAGINLLTFEPINDTVTAKLRFTTNAEAHFATDNIYLFEA